jgi:hypothetical protein
MASISPPCLPSICLWLKTERAAMEIEFLVASNSRHRNALAPSSRVGTFHTRASKWGMRSAYSRGRNSGRRRLNHTVVRLARIDTILLMRPSNTIWLVGSAAYQAREISSDWV